MSMFRNLISTIGGGGGLLPAEYQQVEYIESTGTQYINTGVYGTNNTDYEIKMARLSKTNRYQQYFAGQKSFPLCPKIYMYSTDATKIVIQANSSVFITNVVADNIYNIKIEGINVYVNEALIGTISRNVGTNNVTHWIFNAAGEPTLFAYMRLYRLKMYESGTPIRDFIPCYRKSDDEIGLYDIVNNVFYTNDGTGTFIKGNNV